MPLTGVTVMEQRLAFVLRASAEGANIRALCREVGISPDTAYRLLEAYRAHGVDGLVHRSRRPATTPSQTSPEIEARVLAVRAAHPTWGGRKIHAWLRDQAGLAQPPAPSTITGILRRHGLLRGPRAGGPRAFQRFERAAPNELWQMDFIGHRPLTAGGRVHPLTLLDDHSRFLLALVACAHERGDGVQEILIACFRIFGLPHAILADNGPAWGSSHHGSFNRLEAWLLRIGVPVMHGRPLHPQTQGKVERSNQTIGQDIVAEWGPLVDLAHAQLTFDRFRTCYNTERPHEALGMQVPATRYVASARPSPETLPDLVYPAGDVVCSVHQHGAIWFHKRKLQISEALSGLDVGIRPTETDGVFQVYYCARQMAIIDLREET
ncbi:MAG: IS481 family transposase [Thermomicrobiales bacterium]